MNPGAGKLGVFRGLFKPGRFSLGVWMLIFVMLAGFACNMPALSTRKPEPGPLQFTATLAPTWPVAAEKTIQPTARPAFLPPGLVEVQPLAHSELQPTIEPVFYFNQSMDRASVESAFEFQPQLSVRYEWLDDSTLRLVWSPHSR